MTQPPPPPPFSHPPFTSLPSNPNPISQFQPPHPQNPAPQPPDLSATLSTLNSLIQQSEQTLLSLSTLLPLQHPNQANLNRFASCSFNPHHLLPPNSLFAHFLSCPSSPSPIQPGLLPPLNYTQTLKSSASSQPENGFLQSVQGSESDLCFSLDDFFAEFGCNSFYHDCPGVVSLSAINGVSRTFTLPSVLSVQCENFVSKGDIETKTFGRDCRKILPSEFWATRAEVETWNEYPTVYSYRVLCAILGLDLARVNGLARWVIANSPRYGIVIDTAMRDHIFLLCRLCLKAILKEASTLVDNGDTEMIPGNTNFNCPVLVQVLMWLASQFSILYGQINGKLFAINTVKQCILEAASRVLIFSLEHKVTESPTEEFHHSLDMNSNDSTGGVKVEEAQQLQKSTEEEQNSIVDESVTGGVIFVSQVVAAVAALHERSLFEDKVKALRCYPPLNNYQRMAEHAYVSQRADEERKKRPLYRPIIEHDGLPRVKLSNEDASKSRTREELLAEERDYKRRRMSYRGKKVKRSHLEVMRDIIEDYMDEIKQAGGIGCFEKESGGEDTFPFKPPYVSDTTTYGDMPKKSFYDSSTGGDSPNYYQQQLHSDYRTQATTSKGPLVKQYQQPRRGHHDNHELSEDHVSVNRYKHDREYCSRSPRHVRSSECPRRPREQDEMDGIKHHENQNLKIRGTGKDMRITVQSLCHVSRTDMTLQSLMTHMKMVTLPSANTMDQINFMMRRIEPGTTNYNGTVPTLPFGQFQGVLRPTVGPGS
ncbi:U11/U12 small nuclear ribonucleoprotein 48 kDa protein isoform X3 [Humulus lupulus]|uniref:U11/U12 small nuclear ribonucleoprotein 48 kDa protein isoform X3 n=1 Tax=Humulus lupulus TaxID=3486 RepID=UPI002B4080F2|nr:U11/U12 small nuclear ribonucleoprotein 48 kDa protein isoform X3 [Humulus lupulus]